MKHGAQPPDGPEEDALWSLLGRAPAPRVSPYFARRVVRETVRLEEEGGWAWRLLTRWRRPYAAWSGAAAALAVGLGLAWHPLTRPAPWEAAGVEEIGPQDVEVIANLDNLLAFEENDLWIDDHNAD